MHRENMDKSEDKGAWLDSMGNEVRRETREGWIRRVSQRIRRKCALVDEHQE